jgi:hypothetical protein
MGKIKFVINCLLILALINTLAACAAACARWEENNLNRPFITEKELFGVDPLSGH